MKNIYCLILFSVFCSCAASPASSPEELDRAIPPQRLATEIIRGNPAVVEDTELLHAHLQRAGHGWFYGPGVGQTIGTVGTVFAFPPAGLYFLGNAALDLAGYRQLHLTNALPEPTRQGVLTAYREITSVPGRFFAFLAGEEFVESRAYKTINTSER